MNGSHLDLASLIQCTLITDADRVPVVSAPFQLRAGVVERVDA